MNVELSADKFRAVINLNGNVDAIELESLIRQLARARAEMLPPVPQTRQEAIDANHFILEEDQPSVMISRTRAGMFRLSMRNRGLGWLTALITPTNAASIAAYVNRNTSAANPLDLVGENNSPKH